jgi:hypothetical protein
VNVDLLSPPNYCQYAGGACDQDFVEVNAQPVFFVYAGEPETISSTVEAAVARLNQATSRWQSRTWRMLSIPGQIIFCEICKTMRQAATIVADVTTLNFNVLFEIGYALGLGLPVLPIRDTSYGTDKRDFDSLGVLDTLGYIDFANAGSLAGAIAERLPGTPLPDSPGKIHTESPLYVLKGPVDTEGTVQLMATLKKSGLRFRTHDPLETPRLSLHEARRQVASSVGVVVNLLSPERSQSRSHNAQCALVAGLAMAQQKAVLMLQEGVVAQPIDYRDVVVSYRNATQIPRIAEPFLKEVVEQLQEAAASPLPQARRRLLLELDLGDVAAENEILGLRSYFVTTGPATQARQGHARLVVGRKGAGKTAIFYSVRDSRPRGHDRLVLDLKPEGHQFSELRDFLRSRVGPGLQEHTLVAFWNYILLAELARAALNADRRIGRVDPDRFARYTRLQAVYERHDPGWDADFSQRLVRQMDRISSRLGAVAPDEMGSRLTEIIYSGDVKELTEAVGDYLRAKDSVWLLVDNLDKGWPVRGTTQADILVVRALLDATRKIQHQLEAQDVEFDCLVFLRSDIYEHLRVEMPDKGKDTAIRLDWEDPSLFEEIVKRRVAASTDLTGSFREMWPQICEPLVQAEDSFQYIVDRTLMRPRDLLQFLHRAIDVAVNRGHERVLAEDLLYAEKGYSEDMLLATSFEIGDTRRDCEDILYAFQGAPKNLPLDEVMDRLAQSGLTQDSVQEVVDLLLWFCFFGVAAPSFPEAKYAYDVQGNLRRLLYPISQGDGSLVIHPAFRAALDVS